MLRTDGKISENWLKKADKIPLKDGNKIHNPKLVRHLTKDGSKIEDWQKMTTQPIRGLSDKMRNSKLNKQGVPEEVEVHFYKNRVTGKIDYETVDFKLKGDIQVPWSVK